MLCKIFKLKQSNFNIKQKIILILLICLMTSLPMYFVAARSSEEIQLEINTKEGELDEIEQELSQAQANLAAKGDLLVKAQDGVPKLEAEIEKLEAERELVNLELKLLKEKQLLKGLEKEDKEKSQADSIRSTYMEWRIDNPVSNMVLPTEKNSLKNQAYSSSIITDEHEKILGISAELLGIGDSIFKYEEKIIKLEELNDNLIEKKKELEAEIAYYQSLMNNSYGNIVALTDSYNNIQRSMNSLLEEQKAAAEREQWILEQTENVPVQPDPDPDPDDNNEEETQNADKFYFSGQGRDLYQGHGVGMSQWGAYGAANNGFSYENIIHTYFTEVEITDGYENQNLNVDGYGNMNIEDYLAGLGEIPSRACGSLDDISSWSEYADSQGWDANDKRRNKYIVDNTNTVWDCWPEEAIKAQITVARTYALRYVSSGRSICTTAACQVYSGHQDKSWVAYETKGKVIKYGGEFIDAVYSSDNSQGYGTADNDTIWQSFFGYGTPYPYLRAVNDTAFAASTQWTYWQYSTLRYSYADVDNLLKYINNNELSSIGKVTNIEFERDPSQRIKRVWLTGETGQKKSVGGWWFKNKWNNWMYDSGVYDYIFSQTFFINY